MMSALSPIYLDPESGPNASNQWRKAEERTWSLERFIVK
jgi:hypothetical protein